MQSSLSQIFLTILSLAMFMWVAKYVFVLWQFARQREQINRLEARLAVLRILLKSKLKLKGSKIQDQFKKEKTFLESLNPKLELLTTFSFNRISDYEDVIELLLTISKMLDAYSESKIPGLLVSNEKKKIEQKEEYLKQAGVEVNAPKVREDKKTENAEKMQTIAQEMAVINTNVPGFDKWNQLLRYDKGNIFIIKEIIETTDMLIEKIEFYNLEQQDKKQILKAPEKIHIKNFDTLKSIVDMEQEKSGHKKVDEKTSNNLDDVA